MPRERIQHAKTLQIDAGDTGWTETTPALDVEWQRDFGHVQVAIDFDRERWLTIAKELKDDPQIVRKAIYTDSLSRAEINNMIRTLRRARDASYGADA